MNQSRLAFLFLMISMIAACSASWTADPDGIAGYRMNETSGDLKDWFNGWTGSASNIHQYRISGVSKNQGDWGTGHGLDFGTNTNDAEIVVDTDTTTTPLAVSVWFKMDSTDSDQVIFSQGNPRFEISHEEREEFDGLECNVYDGSSHKTVTTGQSPTGTWEHMVITATNDRMYCYLNGDLEGSIAIDNGIAQGLTGQSIGQSSGSSTENRFGGDIDEFRIYNKNISSSEASNLYNYNTLSYSDGTPSFSNIVPSDGATKVDDQSEETGVPRIVANLSYTVQDSDNSTLSWASIQWKNGTVLKNISNPSSGKTVSTVVKGLNGSTTYEWQIAASDGVDVNRGGNYSFTTDYSSPVNRNFTVLFEPDKHRALTRNIVELPNEGHDLFFWREAESHGPGPNSDIRVAETSDLGRTRSNEQVIYEESGVGVKDQGVVRMDNGRIGVLAERRDLDNGNEPLDPVFIWSDDKGDTWNNKTISTSRSLYNVFFIHDFPSCGGGADDGGFIAYMQGKSDDPISYVSTTDNGDNWSIGDAVPAVSGSHIVEPSVARVNEECKWVMIMRDNANSGSNALASKTTDMQNWQTPVDTGQQMGKNPPFIYNFAENKVWWTASIRKDLELDNFGEGFIHQTANISSIYNDLTAWNGWSKFSDGISSNVGYTEVKKIRGQHVMLTGINESIGDGIAQVGLFTGDADADVDTSAPSISVESPVDSQTYDTSEVDLNVTSSEAADAWKYNLDSNGNTSFTPNTTLTNLSAGNHDLTVWAEFPNNTVSESVSFEVFSTDNQKNIIDQDCSNGFCYTTNSDYNTSNPVSVSGSFYEGQSKTLTWEVNASAAPGDYDFFGFYNSTVSRFSESFTGISTLTVQENTSSSNNSAPSADFTTSLSELSVSTDASQSSDSDGSITDYEWDWTSDGTYEDTGETSSHTYPSEGDYTITLRVTDDDGATDTASKTVSMVNNTDDSDDGGGDTGGGGSGGDETDDGSTISVDGTNATLHAPNSGMRYTGDLLEIKENNSKTIIANGVERQITVDNIVNQTHAEILIDQQNLTTYRETEEFTLESGPGITTLLEEVDVRDVVKLNDTGYVYFTLKSGSPATAPLVFDYQVNDSATFTAQYRKAGPGNTWQDIDSVTETSSVEYGFEQFNTTDIQAGVYEARIKVETSDNTNYTEPSGFYIGEVPAIEILRPFNGETVSKPPNGENYDLTLDYKFEVLESNNVTGIGQYYIDSNDEIYSKRSNSSVSRLGQGDDPTILEQVATFFLSPVYFAYDWLQPDEPDLYYVNSTMQVPSYDTYNGYVNASIQTSSGELTDLNSLPVTVNLVEKSVTNESYQGDRISEVIDEGDDAGDVGDPHTNESFNESIDLDGDNKSDGTFESPYFWPIKPFNGETLTVKRYDEGEVSFSFDMGYKGNLSVNKSIVLKDSDNKTTRINLSKTTSQYNDITVNTTQLSTESWDSNTYTWYGEFTANGTTVYSTEDKINGTSTFKVQEAGALTLASRWIQPVVEGITTVYDVTSDYAEFLVAGFVTVGWYGLFKARKQDFIAKAGGFLWFAGFWWYGAIPQNIQVLTVGLASLVLVIKFWRGEVTL